MPNATIADAARSIAFMVRVATPVDSSVIFVRRWLCGRCAKFANENKLSDTPERCGPCGKVAEAKVAGAKVAGAKVAGAKVAGAKAAAAWTVTRRRVRSTAQG